VSEKLSQDVPHSRESVRGIDTSVPNPARVYDYLLGGKDNYEVDRITAQAGMGAFPKIVKSARSSRAFLARAVRYLACEAGIRQFLDIGTGLPSANNVHEVAQDVAPSSKIVYVDNDPVVLVHARALLTSTSEGVTDYIQADIRDPETILREASRTLDFREPVAVLALGVLHFIDGDEEAAGIIRSLVEATPAGSYLGICHLTADFFPEMAELARRVNERQRNAPLILRDRERVARFFEGLDLVPPGLVQVSKWRPGSDMEAAAPAALWGGVARKTQAPAT
jgi:S-adenosyl methyltransferase